ncbi:MAG: grsT [Rhodospirillales bacterium]|jgi:medium-chain acyl-[acyl-carrier-protein] hydrolase|nr:grsT [Rhodospirillales bacterium]
MGEAQRVGELPVTPYLPSGAPDPRAALRIFCFPYAGGGASVFRKWRRVRDVEFCPVQLPGREARFRETLARTPQAAIPPLLDALGPYLDRPFALFGYSLGANVAFAFANALAAAGLPSPERLVVAARDNPWAPPRFPGRHALPDDAFIAHLRSLGGTPAQVFDNPELLALLLPLLRADFALNEALVAPESTVLACPVVALGGADDGFVDAAGLQGWARATRGPFRMLQVPGGHFFLHEQSSLPDLVATLATEAMA